MNEHQLRASHPNVLPRIQDKEGKTILSGRNMFQGSSVIRRLRIVSHKEQIASMLEIHEGILMLAGLSLFWHIAFAEKIMEERGENIRKSK